MSVPTGKLISRSPGTLNFDGYAAFRIAPEGYLSGLIVTYSYGTLSAR